MEFSHLDYLATQFTTRGYEVESVTESADETITVETTDETFRMWIGSDDDCYQFVSGSGKTVEIPFPA